MLGGMDTRDISRHVRSLVVTLNARKGTAKEQDGCGSDIRRERIPGCRPAQKTHQAPLSLPCAPLSLAFLPCAPLSLALSLALSLPCGPSSSASPE